MSRCMFLSENTHDCPRPSIDFHLPEPYFYRIPDRLWNVLDPGFLGHCSCITCICSRTGPENILFGWQFSSMICLVPRLPAGKHVGNTLLKGPPKPVDPSYQRLSSKVLYQMLTANDDEATEEESIFGLVNNDDAGKGDDACGKSVVSFANEVSCW